MVGQPCPGVRPLQRAPNGIASRSVLYALARNSLNNFNPIRQHTTTATDRLSTTRKGLAHGGKHAHRGCTATMTVSQAALRNLAQLLKTEDDLDKVANLKKQLQTEKSSVEVQLKNLSQSQLDKFLKDMEQLSLCQDDVRGLKDSLDKVNGVAEESFGSINRYELINNITRVHEIFEQSTRIADKVGKFHTDLEEVDHMIEVEIAEYENGNGPPQVPDLLLIHYKLNQLRDFQDQIMELSERSSDDSKFTVKRLTSRTESVVKKFDVLLGNIIKDLVEMAKEHNFSLVVRLAKIIDFEEKQDHAIESFHRVLSAKSKGKKGDTSLFEHIVNGTVQGRTRSRHYKQFFLEKITENVKDIFNNCWEAFEEQENVFAVLDNLSWVFSDLACVQQVLTSLVSPNWGVFKLYYDRYYEELHKLVVRLIELEPETLVILDILDFDNQFKEIMKNEFGMKKNEIQTVIGEEEREKLLDDYLNLLVMKMNEWMGNLEKTEHDVFKQRIQAPGTDSENLMALEGTKIVFQMFSQQCDAAAGSGQGKILAGVINEFGKLLIKRQQGWGELVKVEVQRWLISSNLDPKKKSEGDEEIDVFPPGLIEYLTALANDQMRGADYSEAICNKYAGMVSQKYSSMIKSDLDGVIDGFANLAKQCCDGLMVIIFDDMKVVMDKIFSKDWTSSDYAQRISITLFEYLGELKTNMNNYLFEILAEETLEECILRYLNNLNNDVSFPKKTEKLLVCVKRDFEVFYERFIEFLDESIIKSKFKIVENFMDLATDPDPDALVAHWLQTVENFNDIKPEFLSLVLKARRDIDSSDAKMILPRAKQAQKEFLDQNQYDMKQSFMGRFDLSKKLKKNYL